MEENGRSVQNNRTVPFLSSSPLLRSLPRGTVAAGTRVCRCTVARGSWGWVVPVSMQLHGLILLCQLLLAPSQATADVQRSRSLCSYMVMSVDNANQLVEQLLICIIFDLLSPTLPAIEKDPFFIVMVSFCGFRL